MSVRDKKKNLKALTKVKWKTPDIKNTQSTNM